MKLSFTVYLFLLFNIILATAQSDAVERLTIENGLSQGMIFDVLQTRDGFIWVATKDGLNRYDGYNFKVFSHDPFDAFSLADNQIICLFEDSRGWLWIGTQNKGLDVYNRHTNQFHHFSLNFQLDQTATRFPIRNIAESPDGTIWAVQQGSRLVSIQIPPAWKDQWPDQADLTKETSVVQKLIATPDKKPEELIGLWKQENGDLTLFSTARQYRIQGADQEVQPITTLPLPTYIGSVASGKGKNAGTLWMAANIDELFLFKAGKTVRYQLSGSSWLNHPYLIQEDGHGEVWLAFGRSIWQLTSGKPLDLTKPDWELDRDVTCIKTDRNGNIWIGTTGYGLRKINPKRQLFHAEVLGRSIWRLWRSPRGEYFWRDISEIYRHDPAITDAALPAFPALSSGYKMDMVFDSSGAFWLLGSDEKDPEKGILWRYGADQKIQQTFSFARHPYDYMRLLVSRAGAIWITGAQCQLIRFEPLTGHFDYFDYGTVFGKQAAGVQAFALIEDGNSTLWIGTQQGLVKATPNAASFDFQLIQADPQNPKGLNNNSIACLLADPTDPNGLLWIGTKGGGINRLDLRTGQFQHLSTHNGLPDKVVYGILPGNEKAAAGPVSLWCSTNRGLAKIVPHPTTPVSFDVTTFTAAKGLQDNEFNTQAFFKAANGELLFGGVNGMNHFLPEEIHSDTTPPPVFVVGAEINHQPVSYGQPDSPLSAPVEYLRELRLNYDQNNLSFEFAALDFTDPAQNRYRYRLVGLDADWVETGGIRFAHFTHLAPGRYEFRVQGSNGEGAWQEADHSIVVVVHPPWYRSNLAYLLYFLALAWAGWRAYQFQIRRLQEHEQLIFEQRETERVKAMEQTKTNFFSNITHEFRTPLTLIIEPARRILAKNKDPETLENARHVETNSRRLLALVNQLLDMAKLESGSMGIDLRQGDLEEQIRNIFRSFQPLAEQRGIQLSLKLPDHLPPFAFDPGKVELVLNNLISNALKFTPKGGKVTVTGEKTAEQTSARITVRDTGMGIPADALDKVFDRFYQVDSSHTRTGEGTGIGLALSRELAGLMGGSLTVESTVGQGSVFTFLLPTIASTKEVTPSEPDKGLLENEGPPKTATFRNPAERPSVLLIEDNVELRTFIKQCVADTWQVVEASNGEEGVEKALEIVPDLVISDLMMPRKDGYAVCDELKSDELTSHIPIILLTAKSGMDAKIKGLRTGADDYLTKPFNSEELLVRMENLVENRRRLREHYSQSALPNVAPEAEYLPTLDREFLRRFTLTVEQHLPDEKIGVDDLAQKMLVSRVQLHRKLKAITDQNVTDFVRDYRLNRAMSMLRNHEGMVYEVASKVGFGSEKYFSRAFKEKFGVLPSHIN